MSHFGVRTCYGIAPKILLERLNGGKYHKRQMIECFWI